jgi:hypothetical protein
MAELHWEYPTPTEDLLVVRPLDRLPNGAEDGYEVSLRADGEVVFARTCEGHGDEMGHYYLQLIGEAFRDARKILEQRLTLTSQYGNVYEVEGSVLVGGNFFRVGLTGYVTEEAEWLDVEIWLLAAAEWKTPPTGRLSPYQSAFIRTSVSGAERFGSELLAELDAATEANRWRHHREHCAGDCAGPEAGG